MRRLILLTLVALVAFPLAAHDHWRGPRREVVVEDSCRPHQRWGEQRWGEQRWGERRWDERRWEHNRWERRGYRGYDFDDDQVVLRPFPRPLTPPFQGRVELWLR